jgi:predicted ATPase
MTGGELISRTKSGGVLVRPDLPGWHADIRDRGHHRGFVIRIRREEATEVRVFRTGPSVLWPAAREYGSDLIELIAREPELDASGASALQDWERRHAVTELPIESANPVQPRLFANTRAEDIGSREVNLRVEPGSHTLAKARSQEQPKNTTLVDPVGLDNQPATVPKQPAYQSEIRPSHINQLIERVRVRNYDRYLVKVILSEVRGSHGEVVEFDFPVTAIVGPNGGGKTTILGAAGLAYNSVKPRQFFAKSGAFDASMLNWRIEWELIDRTVNRRDSFRRTATFKNSKWDRNKLERDAVVFGVSRTVPASERTELRKCASNQFTVPADRIASLTPEVVDASQKILGKDISRFSHVSVDSRGRVSLLTGQTDNGQQFSEFHFGAGESSVIRMVMAIELMPDQSLILIEEIENGLHPVATVRMVEYLMEVAQRKRAQAIFTTHSNDALKPLPSEAIWASIRWRAFKGKLDIQALRAIEGTVEAQLAIFTEDDFARSWILAMLRTYSGVELESIEVYGLTGDSMAVSISRFHNQDPSQRFPAICFIDGDSLQVEDGKEVLRLPGQSPEAYVYDQVLDRLEEYAGILAVSLHRRYEDAGTVAKVVRDTRTTNRDAHVLFSQVGRRLGLVPEPTVRDGFLSVWCQAYPDQVQQLMEPVIGQFNS